MSDSSAAPLRSDSAHDSADAADEAEPKLSDEEYVDLLVHRRREDGVTYDDLAHMAGFLYQTDVSAEELEAVDKGEHLPHIREQLERGLDGEGEAPAPLLEDDAPSKTDTSIGGQTLEVDPQGDLERQYENYLERREKWYPNREKLSFDEFEAVAQRWDDEYYASFNKGQVKESDWSTINELERLLCVPPASRLLVTAVAASQQEVGSESESDADNAEAPSPDQATPAKVAPDQATPDDASAPSAADERPSTSHATGSSSPDEPSEVTRPSEDNQPSEVTQPVDDTQPRDETLDSPAGDENESTSELEPGPSAAAPPSAVDSSLDEPEAPSADTDSPQTEQHAAPSASTDAANDTSSDTPSPSEETPSSSLAPSSSDAPASRRPNDPPVLTDRPSRAATTSITDHSTSNTAMNTDELLKGLRAQRNAIDVSLESIEDRLEHYREVRKKIDDAITLLEDDALAPLLGAVKQLHGIAGGDGEVADADLPDRLIERISDNNDTTPASRPSKVSA